MEYQDLVGGYKFKAPLCDIADKYQAPLAMIALVHLRGAQKYEAYSWFNTPWTGNSTVVDNLEAIMRHFTAITQGKIMDSEGLPHIFHMCCRAGMMVTIYAKALSKIRIPYELSPKANRIHVGTWITPTELQALADTYPYDITDSLTLDTCIPYITDLLYEAVREPENQTQDDLNYLFKVICTYAKLWGEKYSYGYELIKQDKLDDESKQFYNLWLACMRDVHPTQLEPIEPEVLDCLYDSTGTNKHKPGDSKQSTVKINGGTSKPVTPSPAKYVLEKEKEVITDDNPSEVPDCDPLSALDPKVLQALLGAGMLREELIDTLNETETQYIFALDNAGEADFEPLLGDKLPNGTITHVGTLDSVLAIPKQDLEKYKRYIRLEQNLSLKPRKDTSESLRPGLDPIPDEDPQLSAVDEEAEAGDIDESRFVVKQGMVYLKDPKTGELIRAEPSLLEEAHRAYSED